jgi:hypothetical protein
MRVEGLGFAVNVSFERAPALFHGTHKRRLHGDTGTSIGRTLVPPSAASGVKLGLLRVVSAPSVSPTLGGNSWDVGSHTA